MEKKKVFKMNVSSGKGLDEDVKFKRYGQPQIQAAKVTDELLSGKIVELSAIGPDAVFNMVKIMSMAKEQVLKVQKYAQKEEPIIILDFGTKKVNFKNSNAKSTSNFYQIVIDDRVKETEDIEVAETE